ncbi:MAG TPA: hypothetical protein VF405_13860 [Gammaproteobacteria bacterium]
MRTAIFTKSAAAAARSYVHIDASGGPGAAAVYTLADPRDVQSPRYVGQTRDPHARFAQHVQTARLWLPDEVPWWVRSPKHRPLYAWIRELHRDGGRLPIMWVEEWVDAGADPLVAERAAIMRWLARGASLLNAEALKLGAQLPLL